MPHEQMDEKQVASYLHLDLNEVQKLASRKKIPCRKARGQFVFRKSDVDHWVETQMHEMDRERLEDIEIGVSEHHGFELEEMLIGPMIPKGGIACPLKSATRDSAIRSLVKLAEKAGMVYSHEAVVAEVRSREELCSTAMIPGVALPHPRHPLPYDIAASFVVVGLTGSGIPFGAADGSLTRLFFLICCKDDRTHLHVLARIGRMLHEQAAVDRLLAAQNAAQLGQVLKELEETALKEATSGR